ncbi:MAG: hypothetical protein OXE48_04080 [Gammaproteobacteria bacterium]|nr:hypothetical protein [Gammaproteobacteria bacterium]
MATATEKKRIVEDFLKRCNHYSDNKLRNYRASLTGADGEQDLAIQDRITHWVAYRAFNEHAIKELKGSELDDWFKDD